jgi:phosphotransacetylase
MPASFREVIETAQKGGAKRLAISFPEQKDIEILGKAANIGLVIPCLVGDGNAIEGMVKGTSLKSLKYEIVDEKNQKEALGEAIRIVRDGRADMLMQGADTHQALMDAIIDIKNGLRKGKLVSYISVYELPTQEKLFLVTDTFINNSPTLAEKQIILDHAIRLAGILGIAAPKVAALAAIEQINLNIPSTLDAAILSKMSERKQFGSAVVEGPIDIDCALSEASALRKGLRSAVTGKVDIYLVPEVDTGHLLAEALVFFGAMQAAGAVMGTAKPVILNIPFIPEKNRMVEIAMAALMCKRGETHA